MSQRGRGSGPDDEDRDGEVADDDRDGGYPLPPSSRPIVPYDPYRPASGDAPRTARNVASESFESPSQAPLHRRGESSTRGMQRRGGESPFLPDDDPLNADAWQLEFDEGDIVEDEFDLPRPAVEREPERPARRPRRQQAQRSERAAEAGTGMRRASRRSAGTATTRERATTRPQVNIAVPEALAGSSLAADQTAMVLLGINLLSVVIMALLLGVRLGGVPSPAVLHLDAAGNPDRWGPPSVFWRLPLMSFFITVMFTVVAWFLHPIDRFAARFALGAAIVAQLVAWVAVIQHVLMA